MARSVEQCEKAESCGQTQSFGRESYLFIWSVTVAALMVVVPAALESAFVYAGNGFLPHGGSDKRMLCGDRRCRVGGGDCVGIHGEAGLRGLDVLEGRDFSGT